jgi:acetylornithine aminotransferase
MAPTFGGNPLAMARRRRDAKIVEEEGLLANAAAVGATLRDGLTRELAGVKGVTEIRGRA